MMLTRWLRLLVGRKRPWAGIANRSTVIYRENGRKMTIAGEMLADGFEIYVASIVAWTQFGRSSKFRAIFELLDLILSALF